MAASRGSKEIDWLYPELLSKDGLIFILRKRYIANTEANDLETLDKEQLVGLYNKYILPLPQRKYRQNRRGKDMTRKQIQLDKKKRRFEPDQDLKKDLSGTNGSPSSRGSVNNFKGHHGNRLKPPPSSEKKVIKLSSSSKTDTTDRKSFSNDVHRDRKRSHDGEKSSGANKSNGSDVRNDSDSSSPKKKYSKISWP